eukprot:822380-Pleurochrysis_carterae.AAC.2
MHHICSPSEKVDFVNRAQKEPRYCKLDAQLLNVGRSATNAKRPVVCAAHVNCQQDRSERHGGARHTHTDLLLHTHGRVTTMPETRGMSTSGG